MVSSLYKFLQTCCKSGPHFMFVLRNVRRSPATHDKVIYMIFLLMMPTTINKFEIFITW